MGDGLTSMGPPTSSTTSNMPNYSTAGNTQNMGGFPRGPLPPDQAGQGISHGEKLLKNKALKNKIPQILIPTD